MTKETLKDKLDGNELDLSLSNLTKVPVKELASLPKATSLDLSCNQLTILPDNFSSLIHIVKLDLSKNSLEELPSNFGAFERLQHLDLLGNKLQTLPVSVARLNNLRWLDLKENPLSPTLNKVVGDCLDDKQCRACAQRVIKYMRAVQAEQDRIEATLQQQKMEEERLQEAARREEEAKQKQIKKRQKQLEKEKRKKDYEAAQAAKRLQEQRHRKEEEDNEETEVRPNGLNAHSKKSSGFSCFTIFITLLMVLVSVCVGIYFFCESDKTNDLCVDIHWGLDQAREKVQKQIKQWQK